MSIDTDELNVTLQAIIPHHHISYGGRNISTVDR